MAKLLEYNTRDAVIAFSTYRGEGTGSYGGFNITHYCGDTAGFPMKSIARRYPTTNGGTKWHLDLWEANSLLLQECGVERERIEIAGVCTFTRHTEFFSARRLGINSGRIFSGIMARQQNSHI